MSIFKINLVSSLSRPLLIFALLGLALTASAADTLETGFLNPPESAKPQTWWHWMNGNITKQGITADLEAMKQIGLSGATIVNVDCSIPRGDVPFMSPAWREDFKFAVQEANRLGLELCVENCAGWSSSGGPWNTVTNAMQRLTSSEVMISGPTNFDGVLPLPPVTLGYYRDIAVLAYKDTSVEAGAESTAAPEKLEIKHAVFEAKSGPGSADVTTKVIGLIQSGQKSIDVTRDEFNGDPAPGSVKQLRVDFTLDGIPATLTVDENDALVFPVNTNQLSAIDSFEKISISTSRTFVYPPPATGLFADEAIAHKDVLDLTKKLGPDGRLRWNVPRGHWTILRLGYTPIGVNNHPAPAEGTGLECDKLSKTALDAHWAGFMQKVLADTGPLAGKTLNSSLIDSYEIGNQDWTPDFREEFRKRRGYDPLPFLPTFTRRVVDDPSVTERFLWDMRRTVADLFAENYYSHFTELCHQHGLTSAIEPYTGPYESLQCGARNDVVMGEFWAGSQGDPSVKMASSVAHIYGKTIAGAESFTGWPSDGRWQADPYQLKPLGDLMFCQGINRFVFHRYAMQPWTNRSPGMTMGPFGINFERTETWWNQGKAWIDYLSRCEFLLQQGRTVTDVAYFTGESAPVLTRTGNPSLPAGYDYDAINSDVLLHGATVKSGRITLASGANYAALILPPDDANMTPAMLNCLRKLIRAGATIVGPAPQSSPSLAGYPNCDKQVKEMTRELWGSCDGSNVLEHADGKGRIVWGKPLAEVFAEQNLKPDFKTGSAEHSAQLVYTHRQDGAADIYFVSNQKLESRSADCTFRVSGMLPEIWHPDTGMIEPAPIWSARDGRTTVRLNFDPAGSLFVVFRRAADGADHIVSVKKDIDTPTASSATNGVSRWQTGLASDGSIVMKAWDNGGLKLETAQGKVLHADVSDIPAPEEINGGWSLSFPPNWGAPSTVTLDKLMSWADHTNAGVRYFSGTATYEKEIEIPAERLSSRRELWLDLGAVKNFAEVSLNGIGLGVYWKPPFRMNITTAAKPGVNKLVVKVTNLWPNRIIGDEQLPADCEWAGDQLKAWPQWLLDGKPSPTGRLTFSTWHHYSKQSPLLESGLLGPVTLRTVEIVPAK